MAKCPFATWDPINGGLGAFNGEPFKIIHHTTEGSSYKGARNAYLSSKSDPHFTVDASTIYQHIDTAETARALKNPAGGVETNRSSAVQIELVGFAGRPKDPTALANVARLCRWIESVHSVPQRWPNGFPRFSTNGKDPGGHNRNSQNWVTESGHYGHSQVPENDHWDPGYTPAEIAVLTPAVAAPVTLEAVPVKALAAAPALELAAFAERGPSAEELKSVAERLLAQLLERLSPLDDKEPGKRLFFPDGIRHLEITVKGAGVEVGLKLSGSAAPGEVPVS